MKHSNGSSTVNRIFDLFDIGNARTDIMGFNLTTNFPQFACLTVKPEIIDSMYGDLSHQSGAGVH